MKKSELKHLIRQCLNETMDSHSMAKTDDRFRFGMGMANLLSKFDLTPQNKSKIQDLVVDIGDIIEANEQEKKKHGSGKLPTLKGHFKPRD